MVVEFIAMVQRICANYRSQQDHEVLKRDVFNDIDPKNGQAGQ